MMAKVTRTLNPLHFEDLEPHRFEDMVRQLAYDFRDWASIEAVGRSGSDEGIDILATERLPIETSDADLDEEEEIRFLGHEARSWIIQCKRERRIGPTKVKKIVKSDLDQQPSIPYGYILAAACDFSKAARDAFRQVMVEREIEEYHLWGKAELEDKLFLPKNDHLLFAYFNISLQVRRRSMRTEVRSKLALKRKLIKTLGEIAGMHHEPVLIRDPRDDAYPVLERAPNFLDAPRWRYWQFSAHQPIDHLGFITRRCFAYVNWETEEWDVLLDYDEAWPNHPDLFGLPENYAWQRDREKQEKYRRYWNEKVPKPNQAWYEEFRCISYERILAIDDIGDAANEGPHLLVEYRNNEDPFEARFWRLITSGYGYSRREIEALEETRIKFFPDVIPDLPDPEIEANRKEA